jgi:hypothetical protein
MQYPQKFHDDCEFLRVMATETSASIVYVDGTATGSRANRIVAISMPVAA